MKYRNTIKAFLLTALSFAGMICHVNAQDFTTVTIADLQAGSVVKGIYLLELGDNTGMYLKEESNGTLASAPLDKSDERFYFWVSENTNTRTFQLHSASTQGAVIMLKENGSFEITPERNTQAANLLLRMDSQGPLRDTSELATIALASVITQALDDYTGTADCRCYGFSLENETLIKFHKRDFSQEGYTHFPISKTSSSSTSSVSQNTNSTRLTVPSGGESQNFVSSLFYTNGFGINDFQITATPGTEAVVGLLDYTHHQFTARVYNKARPKIGLKLANDKISLLYLSGDQELPSTVEMIDGEVETNFNFNLPVYFGFENQNTFAAIQNGDTVRMKTLMPADLFLNQSISQTARVLVTLDAGNLDLAYKTANGLIGSENDNGIDNGANIVSTEAFMPYNKGNSLVNRFDWQKTKWKVRFAESGDQEVEVFSPFYSSDVEMSSISARFDQSGSYLGGEDYSAFEGWELVKANLGFNADGTVRNEAPQYPFIIFYDRVSATLRTFVYAKNEGETNQLNLSMGVVGGIPDNQNGSEYTPLLWGSLQQFTTLDDTEPGIYTKSIKFYGSEGRKWYFFDHIMEYDPCSEFFESSIEIAVSKTVKGELSLVGRLEGASVPAGTPEYNEWADERENFLMGVMASEYGALENSLGDISFNQYEKFDLLNFQEEITGTLVGADIPEWEKESARLEWETQALDAQREEDAIQAAAEDQLEDGIFGFFEAGFDGLADIPGVGSLIGAAGKTTLGRIRSTIKIVEGASTLLEDRGSSPSQQLANAKKLHYESIRDQVKYDDQAIRLPVPPPRPHVVFGELALKGTLSITIDLDNNYYISTPGAKYSNEAPEWRLNGTRGSAPLYNQPMGKFAMLNQPEFGLAIAYDGFEGDGDIMKAYLKINQKPYFATNSRIHGKITDAFKLALSVKTTRSAGKSISRTTKGYHNQFSAESGAMPGEMDISDMIDWEIIGANVQELADQSPENIITQLPKWITISYDVWHLTLTSLKARSLEYVMASGNQFFTGTTSFELEQVPGYNTNFMMAQIAKELATESFPEYMYGNHEVFGTNYQISNNQQNFAAVMYDYCAMLNEGGVLPDTTVQVATTVSPQIMPEEEMIPGLTVYPNPTSGIVNFELSTDMKGEISMVLYDYMGKALIRTSTDGNGFGPVTGRIDMSVLAASGMYIFQMTLPDGTVISERIIRE